MFPSFRVLSKKFVCHTSRTTVGSILRYTVPHLTLSDRDSLCVLDNQETPLLAECHLQSTIDTSYTTINPFVYHYAASNTVGSQCLPIIISIYVSKYHSTVVTTELSAYLDCTF